MQETTNKGKWSVIKNGSISSGGFLIVNINNVLTTVGGIPNGLSSYCMLDPNLH